MADAIYLGTVPDATFAVVHLPSAPRAGGTGVVVCPPLGWDEECTYRARRAWGEALALAGHPALRLQLPGTGDSPGSLAAPERLSSWADAVSAGATWLREEHGCARVCGLGIGFGGALAWLAVAEGAPVDDLILWAVPPRGRRLVRELRAAAALDIDTRVRIPAASAAPPACAAEPEDGTLLDEAGQTLPAALLEAIGAIDLRATPLPEPERRRVLLFQRAGMKADGDLAGHLQSTGAQVTVADGDSYDAMMRYVQHSIVPDDAIARSVGWLAEGERRQVEGAGELVPAHAPGRPVSTSRAIEFEYAGETVRETPVCVDVTDGRIRAVVTEPVSHESAGLCVVFFSGGADRRTGPNRLWVEASRRWAARGVCAVRIDPPGVGDAEGDESEWSELRAHYSPARVAQSIELLDALEARGIPGRFAAVGFCSGAFRAVHLALADPRVVGVGAIGLPFFHWTWWTVNIRDNWLAVREPKPGDTRLKLAVVAVVQRCLKFLGRAHHAAVVLGQPFPNRGERLIRELAERGTELVLLLKSTSYTLEQLEMPRRRKRLRKVAGLRVNMLPGDDQRFRPLICQSFVSAALDSAVDRLAAPGPTACPTVPDAVTSPREVRPGPVAAPHHV